MAISEKLKKALKSQEDLVGTAGEFIAGVIAVPVAYATEVVSEIQGEDSVNSKEAANKVIEMFAKAGEEIGRKNAHEIIDLIKEKINHS